MPYNLAGSNTGIIDTVVGHGDNTKPNAALYDANSSFGAWEIEVNFQSIAQHMTVFRTAGGSPHVRLKSNNEFALHLQGASVALSGTPMAIVGVWHKLTLEYDENNGDFYGTGTEDSPVARVLLDDAQIIGWTEGDYKTTSGFNLNFPGSWECDAYIRNLKFYSAPSGGAQAENGIARELRHHFPLNETSGTTAADIVNSAVMTGFAADGWIVDTAAPNAGIAPGVAGILIPGCG